MGRRSTSEGDTLNLTNPGPDATVADAPAIVAGFAGWWNVNGVPMGEKSGFVARQVGRFNVTGPAGGIAEGDKIVLKTADGLLYKSGASGAGEVTDYGWAIDAVPEGETRAIEVRLISRAA